MMTSFTCKELRGIYIEEADDKLVGIASLKAQMNHELRTRLNAIMGFSQVLKRDDLSRIDRQIFTDIICTESERLLLIISHLMDRVELPSCTAKHLPEFPDDLTAAD